MRSDAITASSIYIMVGWGVAPCSCSRVQLKCDCTWWHAGGEVMGKLANGVGSQYSSHYLRTCIQHYHHWCTHIGCQQSTEQTLPPIWMDLSLSPKDDIWFLRMCYHISNRVYLYSVGTCCLHHISMNHWNKYTTLHAVTFQMPLVDHTWIPHTHTHKLIHTHTWQYLMR